MAIAFLEGVFLHYKFFVVIVRIRWTGGLLAGLLFCSCTLWAQRSGHRITVKVPTLKDTTCFLARYYGDKQYLIDTTRADASGKAVFEGPKPLDGGLYLFVFPDKRYFEFIIDREQHFSLETSWDDPVQAMKISGSRDNQLFYEFLNQAIVLQQQMFQMQERLKKASRADSILLIDSLRLREQQIQSLRNDYIAKYPETFLAKVFLALKEPTVPEPLPILSNGRPDSTFPYRYYKTHFWDQVDLTDSRLLRSPVLAAKLKKYFDEVLPKIPDTIKVEIDRLLARAQADSEMYRYLTWWFTYTYETSKIMGMDAVFVHMVENYYIKRKAWWMDSATVVKLIDRARKIAPNLIGNVAPELVLQDTSGRWQVLSKVPARYTILVFYDPDCGHCQKEVPKIKQVYEKWKHKGVMVYAVDIEVDTAKWKKFIREHQLDWINVSDPHHRSNFRLLYDVFSTPVIYVLDQQKKIRAKRIAADQIEEVLEFLEKNPSRS